MRITVLSLAALLACGGGNTEGPKDPTSAGSNTKTTPGDVSFDVPPIQIQGTIYQPDARPPMPLYDPKGKTDFTKADLKTLQDGVKKQQGVYQSANAKDLVLKQAQAAILATLLYRQAKVDPANFKQAWTDARQVLRDVQQLAGKNVDDITLRMLGSLELLLEDFAAAEAAWGGLVQGAKAKDKELPTYKAWYAYSLLRENKNAEAIAVVKGEKLDPKEADLDYMIAWTRWRSGDQPGAWEALMFAANNWGPDRPREGLEFDLLLFAGRGNVPFNQ
ncbi:MAG TPA: hypothetical protein VGO00_10950, partial [Kofleriaceae bacterium]|nr:hypothetical protein [Kofleriaceae bacterium]